MGQLTGRPRAITRDVIAGRANKLSEESCGFKTYKEMVAWVEKNYQISVKHHTLHKQVHYRMNAKLKVPKPASIKKDNLPNYRVKKKLKKLL
jgi:putative transposase